MGSIDHDPFFADQDKDKAAYFEYHKRERKQLKFHHKLLETATAASIGLTVPVIALKTGGMIMGIVVSPLVSNILFIGGAAITFGTAIFGIANIVLAAYRQQKMIMHVDNYLWDTINNLSREEIIAYAQSLKEKSTIKNDAVIDKRIILNLGKQKMRSKMIRDVFQTGLVSSLCITGSFLTASIMFPPLLVVFASIAAAVVVVGLLASFAAYNYQVGRLDNKLKNIKITGSDDSACDTTIALGYELTAETDNKPLLETEHKSVNSQHNYEIINEALERQQKNIQQKSDRGHEHEHHQVKNIIEQVALSLLTVGLLFRAFSAGQFAFSIMGAVTGIGLSAACVMLAVVEAVKHYQKMNEKYREIDKTTRKALKIDVHKRPYGLLGNTAYERYLLDHQQKLVVENKLLHEKSLREMKNIIKQDPNRYAELLKDAEHYALANKIREYAADKRFAINKNNLDDIIKQYSADRVVDDIAKRVLKHGIMNTLEISVAIAAIAMVMPQFLSIFLGVAAGILVLGIVTTIVISQIQKHRFHQRMMKDTATVSESYDLSKGDTVNEQVRELLLEPDNTSRNIARVSLLISEDDDVDHVNNGRSEPGNGTTISESRAVDSAVSKVASTTEVTATPISIPDGDPSESLSAAPPAAETSPTTMSLERSYLTHTLSRTLGHPFGGSMPCSARAM